MSGKRVFAPTSTRTISRRSAPGRLFVALMVAWLKRSGEDDVMRHPLFVTLCLPMLSGCVVGTVASTAVDVVTLPVKAVSAGVDAVTTSQKEADQKRGREARRLDEERGKQIRLAEERCRKGKALPTDNCTAALQR